MELNDAQHSAVYRAGYLHIPSAISHELVDGALASINALNLFRSSPAHELANALVAPDVVQQPGRALIALRFPQADLFSPKILPRRHAHANQSTGRRCCA